MPVQGLDIPEWLHKLLTEVNLNDITHAMTNVTLREVNHLVSFTKGRELNAETITKLYEEASKFSGAGTAVAAAALVIFVIIFHFPMAVATPFLTMLGFTNIGPAAASLAATFQSMWGVNAFFSLLQSAAMSGYGAPIVAGVVKGASIVGGTYTYFKLWALGNYTWPKL
ncbi:hypothetical protein D6D01_08345 [Aureobasidium pullulans]|uniref:Uncharacterized protein n=1 Tax=Aureobasidium pullulans TaxID=5580 RepID=A0A4S9KC60_AURPU|nr:hypothetical protein D6D01_08345 [Aureobasidium pullulans]